MRFGASRAPLDTAISAVATVVSECTPCNGAFKSMQTHARNWKAVRSSKISYMEDGRGFRRGSMIRRRAIVVSGFSSDT